MDRVEIIFNEKLSSLVQTYEELENILEEKDVKSENHSIHLQISQSLEQLKLAEASLATIASIPTEPNASELNDRINTITQHHSKTVSQANARLLDLETKIAEGLDIPDSDEETEYQLTAPKSTTYTPTRSHKPKFSASSLLKPPQLSIPTFQGDPKTFPTFWRQFTALIHNDPDLNNRQKSIYLAEALKSSARVHLENKSLDGTDYDRIINTLKTTYSPKLNISYRIYDELSRFTVTRNDPSSIRCRVNEIRALLDQLDDDHLYRSEDPAWVKLITTKFPTETINMLCWRSSRATTIKQLLINIEETADSMESLSIYLNKGPIAPPIHLPQKHNSARYTGHVQEPSNNRMERPCVFCDQRGHRSAKCVTVVTPQQRRDVVKQKNRCWICFSPSHTSTNCTFDKCRTCNKNHHISLCIPMPIQNSRTVRGPAGVNCTSSNPVPDILNPAFLMISKIAVQNPITGTYHPKTVFLDTGATHSFVHQAVVDECKLKVLNTHAITTTGFTGNADTFATSTVETTIRTPFGKLINMHLLTSPKPLTGNLKCCSLSPKDREFLEQSNLILANQFVEGETVIPDIILGMDWCDPLIHDKPPIILPSGLKIRHTQVGPCIYGKSNNPSDIININTLIMNPQIPEETMIKQLFEIDNLGISPHDGALNKSELFFNDYTSHLRFDEGFITAPLPLKINSSQIQSNRSLALATLNRLQKSLKTDSTQLEVYDNMIKQYIAEGVVEHVPEGIQTGLVYYMPHRGVWKPQKAKPLRIVFNASAKQRGQLSLNDVTVTGDSFNNKIIDILIGIRTKKYFLMCDIEGAFTQIRIAEDHKNLCRFMWLKDPQRGTLPDNIMELRFNRLAFGITASPAILNMSLHTFLRTANSNLANDSLRYLYVDNIFYTTNELNELDRIYQESKALFTKVSMNVREYFSNAPQFNESIDRGDTHPETNPKILGVGYRTAQDMLVVSFQVKTQNSYTKRDLLSCLHSIYDPLGLVAPLILHYKLQLRQAMNGVIAWKDQVPTDIVQIWNSISQKLGHVRIQVPRKLPTITEQGELWIFVDASVQAIASCGYYVNQAAESPLIMGKLKLAPKNRTLTIPRLEMSAILMGIKIAETIHNNLQQQHLIINIASDSQIALSWLFSKKTVPVFISNLRQSIEQIVRRLEERGATVSFHYVDTHFNPADIGTRGTTDIEQLRQKWLQAPSWLHQSDNRPAREFKLSTEEEEPIITILPSSSQMTETELLFSPEKFSNYFQLKRVTNLVLRAALCFLKRSNKQPSSPILRLAKTEQDKSITFRAGEILLIREAQKHLKPNYLKQFQTSKTSFGIIILSSRLGHSSLPSETKHPILLPKKSPLGTLVLRFLHTMNAHAGVSHLLCLFLGRFYMASARQVCKTIVKRCVSCQRVLSRPFTTEFFAPLPEDRITKAMPFRHTGLDCIGPIKYRKTEQVYIVIFTCLTVRAIHLEPIPDMSSPAFFNAFIRFVARRGLPHIIRSDNGSNFTHSAKILSMMESYNREQGCSFMNYVRNNNIIWIFNTPSAPWTGGVWERLVAITKQALYKSLSLKLVEKDQLLTSIIKIEGIINSRPLTYTDSESFHENPLTPADFLTSGSPVLIPGANVEQLGETLEQPQALQSNKEAFENLQKIEIIAESFWTRWSKEYLTSLRHAYKSRHPKEGKHHHPQQNEVVLVEEDNINRINWKMARVTELLPSSDNQPRSVRIAFGNGKEAIKPIQKLYPLELKDELNPSNNVNINHVNVQQQTKSFGGLAYLLKFLLLFHLIIPNGAYPTFTCTTRSVEFLRQENNSTICINHHCQPLLSNQSLSLQLSITVAAKKSLISRISETSNQTQICKHPHPCDFPPPAILHLLGNPHCDPVKAISVALSPLVFLMIIALGIKCIHNARQRPRVEPVPPVRYIPSQLFALAAIITLANACNEVHVHKNVELSCDSTNNCSQLINEDILFNPLQRTLCSHIVFQNTTVGKFEIQLLGNRFTCKKATQGFTKITNLTIYASHHCVGTEYCPLGEACDTIQQDTVISDFSNAYENPGKTYCTRAGGGLFNNCGLPLQGCVLFRPTYQPETEGIFEEIQCIQWRQEVDVKINIEYLNNSETYTRLLQPYRKYDIQGMTLRITSISEKILNNLNNIIFLVSPMRSYMISDERKPAVICNTQLEAQFSFNKCHIRKPCNCLGAAAQLSCNCNSASIRELENKNKLPKSLPNFRITEKAGTVVVTSEIEETVISIENPTFSMQSLYNNLYPCFSDQQETSGCYNCPEGVALRMTCETKDKIFALLECESFSRAIECSSNNPMNLIQFLYDKPHLEENCTLSCGKAEKQIIRLSTVLHYVYETDTIPGTNIVRGNATAGLVWNMPHIGPLWTAICNNWTWIVPIGATLSLTAYGLWTLAPLIAPLLFSTVFSYICIKKSTRNPPPAVSGNA